MAFRGLWSPVLAGYRAVLRSRGASSGRGVPLSSAASVLVPAVADSDFLVRPDIAGGGNIVGLVSRPFAAERSIASV